MTETRPADILATIDAVQSDVLAKRCALEALEDRAQTIVGQLEDTKKRAAAAAVDMAQGEDRGRAAFDLAGQEVTALQAARSAMMDRLIPEAVSALERAQGIAAALCRQASYDEAARQSAEAQARLRNEYPEICGRFVDLLTAVTLAAASVEAANRDRPSGSALLEDPESAVRDVRHGARRVVAEEEVSRWVVIETGRILSETEAAEKVQVREDGQSGYIANRSGLAASSPSQAVEIRPCILTLFEPERAGSKGERLATTTLPGLAASDPAFWHVERSPWAGASWQPSLSTVLDQLFSETTVEPYLPRTSSEIRLK